MGLLSAGVGMLSTALATDAVDVTYTRLAGGAAVSMVAVIGRTGFDQQRPGTAGQPRVETNAIDLIVETSYLVQSGVSFIPAKGDRAAFTLNGTSYVYECSPQTSGSAWDWSDHATRTRVRIHCKKVNS